jgi:hypothetical protein
MILSLLISLMSTAGEVSLPGAAEQERFKSYFTQGEALYQQGEYGAAIWNFMKADRLLATPEVVYDLAKCHEKLGDLAFATFYYRLYLKRSPAATDALDVAERLGTTLSKAEGEGRGFLEVQVPGGDKLLVANQRFPEGPVALFLPPGDYEISASFPTGVKKVVVQIRTGKTTTSVFEPVPPPLLSSEPGAPEGAVDVDAAVSTSAPRKTSGLRIASYVTAGLGVAAAGVGTVLAVMSAQQANQLQTDRTLPFSQAQALANSANSNAVGANILWGVGGAAVAGGVVMFVLSMPEPGMPSQPSSGESQ